MEPAINLFHRAFAEYNGRNIQIDVPEKEVVAETQVSRVSGGAWVQAWVWVADEPEDDEH